MQSIDPLGLLLVLLPVSISLGFMAVTWRLPDTLYAWLLRFTTATIPSAIITEYLLNTVLVDHPVIQNNAGFFFNLLIVCNVTCFALAELEFSIIVAPFVVVLPQRVTAIARAVLIVFLIMNLATYLVPGMPDALRSTIVHRSIYIVETAFVLDIVFQVILLHLVLSRLKHFTPTFTFKLCFIVLIVAQVCVMILSIAIGVWSSSTMQWLPKQLSFVPNLTIYLFEFCGIQIMLLVRSALKSAVADPHGLVETSDSDDGDNSSQVDMRPQSSRLGRQMTYEQLDIVWPEGNALLESVSYNYDQDRFTTVMPSFIERDQQPYEPIAAGTVMASLLNAQSESVSE